MIVRACDRGDNMDSEIHLASMSELILVPRPRHFKPHRISFSSYPRLMTLIEPVAPTLPTLCGPVQQVAQEEETEEAEEETEVAEKPKDWQVKLW